MNGVNASTVELGNSLAKLPYAYRKYSAKIPQTASTKIPRRSQTKAKYLFTLLWSELQPNFAHYPAYPKRTERKRTRATSRNRSVQQTMRRDLCQRNSVNWIYRVRGKKFRRHLRESNTREPCMSQSRVIYTRYAGKTETGSVRKREKLEQIIRNLLPRTWCGS